jgi:DNA-binding response OmpR family regulator
MNAQLAPSILIVEDDLDASAMLRPSLEALLGAEVTVSSDPEYGFELALKGTFDILLFDLGLRRLPGDTLYRLLWTASLELAGPQRRVPPVIWLAGPGTSASRIREANALPGSKGVLRKPIDLATLVERVGAALPKGGAWALA